MHMATLLSLYVNSDIYVRVSHVRELDPQFKALPQ